MSNVYKTNPRNVDTHPNQNGQGHIQHGNGNGHHKNHPQGNLPIGDCYPFLLVLIVIYSLIKHFNSKWKTKRI